MHPLRPNRFDVFKQGATGFMIVAGVIACVCSGIMIVVFSIAGVYRGTYTREPITNRITDAGTLNWVPITSVLFVLGIALILAAVTYGLLNSFAERSGRRRSAPAKVLARYAFNREGHMLVSQWEIEGADQPRYYVRLDFGPQLGTTEVECVEPVFYQCGEGMNGVAELQGKWLGAFHPNTGQSYQSEHMTQVDQPQDLRSVDQ